MFLSIKLVNITEFNIIVFSELVDRHFGDKCQTLFSFSLRAKQLVENYLSRENEFHRSP